MSDYSGSVYGFLLRPLHEAAWLHCAPAEHNTEGAGSQRAGSLEIRLRRFG
jgi:hypothetical protein